MNAPDRSAWLAERRTGIGGSDIAALLGLSPYRTPLQLWMEKTGRGEEQHDADAIERMHWGTVLEDVVARHYADQRAVKVQRINGLLRHPECAIAIASLDRVIVSDGSRARFDGGSVKGANGVLECKTAHAMARNSSEWGTPGTDEVPQAYWLQCQWYLGISGLPVADLAVLFGGQKFATYTMEADAALFADLLDEAEHWWRRHIVADVPPEPTTEDDARRMWKSHVAGREKIVSADVAEAVRQLAETKERIATLERSAQDLRDIICSAFGEAESIGYMGRRLATWKANKASDKTDWKLAFVDAHCALGVGADDPRLIEAIKRNTTTTEGARVLRLNSKEL